MPKDRIARGIDVQQKLLLRAYDTWGKRMEYLILAAVSQGATTNQIETLVTTQLPRLGAKLEAITTKGMITATNIASNNRPTPRVMSNLTRRIAESTLLVRETMLPHIGRNITEKLRAGAAADPKILRKAIVGLRSRPAQYAGGFWLMIFETKKEIGIDKERVKRRAGEKVEPVRWVLDPAAEHCMPSAGYYGCPELAGEYLKGWSSLPTVPAGQVTCRGNCRCRIEVFKDGTWQGGI